MSALTKILIVLQLVFAVAVSVLLVLMVSRQEDYKKTADTYRLSSLASATQVTELNAQHATDQARVADAEKDRTTADNNLAKERATDAARAGNDSSQLLKQSADISSLQTQVATLTAAVDTANKSNKAKDDELAQLRPQVAKATTQYNEVARRNNELENQVRSAQQAIEKLQEQLVKAPGSGGTTMNGAGTQVQPMITASSGVPTSAAINAKISNVMNTAGRTLIEMPLGTRDGIQQNTPLFVYRSTGYVGDAVVERVTADTAVAVITKTKQGETVQAGDTVSTLVK